jgi:5-methylcytosine-specific restriction endonuclease McrA
MKQRTGYRRTWSPEVEERFAKNQCPCCGLPKSDWKRRKDWSCCSVKCSQQFWKSTDGFISWPDLRIKAFERDHYTCCQCKKQPKPYRVKYWGGEERIIFERKDYSDDQWNRLIAEHLIGDHIKPIALGGDEFDLENIQTLCRECNRIKTKQDQGMIAKQRRVEKLQGKGQKFL